MFATVAQSVEQLIRNQQVASSSLASSSKKGHCIVAVPFLELLRLVELRSRERSDAFLANGKGIRWLGHRTVRSYALAHLTRINSG